MGRIRVGTKAPARNARKYGCEFIVNLPFRGRPGPRVTGNRAAPGSPPEMQPEAGRGLQPAPSRTTARAPLRAARTLQHATCAAWLATDRETTPRRLWRAATSPATVALVLPVCCSLLAAFSWRDPLVLQIFSQ